MDRIEPHDRAWLEADERAEISEAHAKVVASREHIRALAEVFCELSEQAVAAADKASEDATATAEAATELYQAVEADYGPESFETVSAKRAKAGADARAEAAEEEAHLADETCRTAGVVWSRAVRAHAKAERAQEAFQNG